MNIEQLDNSKVLISLCNEDMQSFRLDYETIGFSNPHSRTILRRILSLACTNAGISADNKSMIVEALPSSDGCMLLVSLVDKETRRRRYRIKRVTQFPCYMFTTAEALLSAVEKLCDKDNSYYNNSAYLYTDKYYLVFDYPALSKRTGDILSEYATSCKADRAFVARLGEHGKLLCRKNAIAIIGGKIQSQ